MTLGVIRSLVIRSVGVALLTGPLLLTGCLGRSDEGPTVQVSGKVTLDGEPVSEGAICFKSPSTADVSRATLSTDGTYTLSIVDAKIGDVYNVYFGPAEQEGEVLSEDSAGAPAAPIPPSPPPVPTKYQRAETSGLTASIDNGNDAEFNFELTAK